MADQDNPARAQEEKQVETDKATEMETVKTETLTKAEHEAQMAKMQSTFEKKAKQAEREAKEAKAERDSVRSEITAFQEQLSSLTAEIQRRELEGLDDLPQGRKIAALLETARRKEADLIKKEQNLKKLESTALEGLKFKDALSISKEYDIDVDELMECNSMADMYKKAAQITREKMTSTSPQKAEIKPEVKIPSHIDSGTSTGTGKGRVWKGSEINNMTSDQRFANHSEINKANKEGRIDHTK